MLVTADFIENEKGFQSPLVDIESIDVSKLTLLVKAHEKEIYDLNDHMVIAKPHKDNNGDYPFSKMDFLSHQLLNMVFPEQVPIVYAASFNGDDCFYVVEKVALDPLHQAYNIVRQSVHKEEGLDYQYNKAFLNVSNLEENVKAHDLKVLEMQKACAHHLETYGIAFDHSHVNITWRDDKPVALEVHKCHRPYLFDYDKCLSYFKGLDEKDLNKAQGLKILERMKELDK